jgi:hypothetical protein
LSDKATVYAKAHGTAKEQNLAWESDNYSVICAGKTKSGNRCRNLVREGYMVYPDVWLRRQVEYCSVHEGEISR